MNDLCPGRPAGHRHSHGATTLHCVVPEGCRQPANPGSALSAGLRTLFALDGAGQRRTRARAIATRAVTHQSVHQGIRNS